MSSIETTKEAAASHNSIALYHGCFVLLKNGDVVGPLIQRWLNQKEICYVFQDTVWDHSGFVRSWHGQSFAISRVLPEEHAGKPQGTLLKADGDPKADPSTPKVSIAPNALRAAMEAGLRAKPAYEDFVKAIVTAAFAAMPMDTFAAVMEKEADDRTVRLLPNVTFAEIAQVIDKALDPWERKHNRCVPPGPIAKAIIGLLKFKLNEAYGKHNSEIDKAVPENQKAEPTEPRRPMTTPAGEMLHLIPEWRLRNLYAYGTITQEQFDAEMARRPRS